MRIPVSTIATSTLLLPVCLSQALPSTAFVRQFAQVPPPEPLLLTCIGSFGAVLARFTAAPTASPPTNPAGLLPSSFATASALSRCGRTGASDATVPAVCMGLTRPARTSPASPCTR